LEAGLRLVDRDGLESLSMRKLAQELGVDPMSLYNHVENKDALLDGLVELLWEEVALPGDDTGWEDMLRSIAGSLRGLARVHPHAHSLLLSRQVVPQSALRLSDVALHRLQRAGFERDQAARIVCTTLAYAIGYGVVELSSMRLGQPGPAGEVTTDLEQLMRIIQSLPRDTPPQLVEVARLICGCDMDMQFIFGLDLLLRGIKDLGVETTV
jgi:AcrR family transcriptional regulator